MLNVLRAVNRQATRHALRAAQDPDRLHSDFNSYRRVTGEGRRDLTETEHSAAIKRQFEMMDRHPIANRYGSLMREWTVPDAFQVTAEDELIQETLDQFWQDPRNEWETLLPMFLEVMTGTGILALPARVTADRAVVLDYFDPGDLTGGQFLEGSNRVIDVLYHRAPGELGTPKPYRVIRAQRDPSKLDTFGRLMGEDPRAVVGKKDLAGVLYFRRNCRPNSLWGRGDYLASLDYWSVLDELHFAYAERALMMARFMGDIEITGNDAAVDRAHERYRTIPGYATVPVHNEREKHNIEAPTTNAGDAQEQERMLGRYASTPTGIPRTILMGDTDTGPRAVAAEASDPAYLHGKRIQDELRGVVMVACQYWLDTAYILNPARFQGVESWDFEVRAPQLLRRDPTKGAGVLVQVTNALSLAVREKWIDRESAAKDFLRIREEVGLEPLEWAEVEERLASQQDEFDPATREALRMIFQERQLAPGEQPTLPPGPETEPQTQDYPELAEV